MATINAKLLRILNGTFLDDDGHKNSRGDLPPALLLIKTDRSVKLRFEASFL